MPNLSTKKVVQACRLSYEGNLDKKISEELDVSVSTISRWRQLALWKETENKLIEATIQVERKNGNIT